MKLSARNIFTGTVASSALAAYGFSRIEWKGRDTVFVILLATMMIPLSTSLASRPRRLASRVITV